MKHILHKATTFQQDAFGSCSLLSADEWVEFNCLTWKLTPIRLSWPAGSNAAPSLRVCLYANRRGQLQQPPLNVYIPVHFRPTPTEKPQRIERQWRDLAGLFAKALAQYRIVNPLTLPPEVHDVRPFQWEGLWASPAYTYIIQLPYDQTLVSSSVRKSVNKAVRAGYSCRIAQPSDFNATMHCLRGTEDRQHFRYPITVGDLQNALRLLGPERFRVYLCLAPSGEPAATRVVLAAPGDRAIDWLAGTRSEHLHSGATQLLIRYVVEDLAAAGCVAFDFAGANLVGVSAAKSEWGGRLMVMYRLSEPSVWAVFTLLLKKLFKLYRRHIGQRLRQRSTTKQALTAIP